MKCNNHVTSPNWNLINPIATPTIIPLTHVKIVTSSNWFGNCVYNILIWIHLVQVITSHLLYDQTQYNNKLCDGGDQNPSIKKMSPVSKTRSSTRASSPMRFLYVFSFVERLLFSVFFCFSHLLLLVHSIRSSLRNDSSVLKLKLIKMNEVKMNSKT